MEPVVLWVRVKRPIDRITVTAVAAVHPRQVLEERILQGARNEPADSPLGRLWREYEDTVHQVEGLRADQRHQPKRGPEQLGLLSPEERMAAFMAQVPA